MAEKLEISDKQVRTAKDNLIGQGRVKREGPDKGGHWEVLK
jgi:predicted HTH transcriptional regulator